LPKQIDHVCSLLIASLSISPHAQICEWFLAVLSWHYLLLLLHLITPLSTRFSFFSAPLELS
jgi:hypothetical protein